MVRLQLSHIHRHACAVGGAARALQQDGAARKSATALGTHPTHDDDLRLRRDADGRDVREPAGRGDGGLHVQDALLQCHRALCQRREHEPIPSVAVDRGGGGGNQLGRRATNTQHQCRQRTASSHCGQAQKGVAPRPHCPAQTCPQAPSSPRSTTPPPCPRFAASRSRLGLAISRRPLATYRSSPACLPEPSAAWPCSMPAAATPWRAVPCAWQPHQARAWWVTRLQR